MYLVSDLSHKPVSTFDDIDEAVACVTGWYQRSSRHTSLEPIPGSTMLKVLPLEDPKNVLGYITDGVPHNPSIVRY